MILKRRQFIQTGLTGGLLLSLSGWLNAAGPRKLSAPEREMLGAVAAVFLEGALPKDGEARKIEIAHTLEGVAKAVSGLSLATRKEVGELFGLLTLLPGRRLIAGVAQPWTEASQGEVGEFLQSWRTSRLDLLQSGYAALHDLIFGAWYARPDNWAAIGYPGPPEVL